MASPFLGGGLSLYTAAVLSLRGSPLWPQKKASSKAGMLVSIYETLGSILSTE